MPPTVNYQLSTVNCPAELYHNSSLSLWLSVDPLSDKYPGVSPYAYCGNNPIVMKDPDGSDIIDVDQKTGRTTITRQEGNDILRCGKKTVELSGNGVYRQALEAGEKDGNNGGTLLLGLSKADSKRTFNFMADNTNVEWGFLETLQSEEMEYSVGSAHSSDTESLIYNRAMRAVEGSVVRYDHSHPTLSHSGTVDWDWLPSTPQNAANSEYVDTDAWNDLMQKNHKVTLGIRYGGGTTIFIKAGSATDSYPDIRNYLK